MTGGDTRLDWIYDRLDAIEARLSKHGIPVPPPVRPAREVCDDPLAPEFLLQVRVSQSLWLEERRREWGLKSRAETIRRIIGSAMIK